MDRTSRAENECRLALSFCRRRPLTDGRGKSTGALAGHPADLLAQALSALVDRSSLDPALWTTSSLAAGGAGEQSATPGRGAARGRLADVGAVGDDRAEVRLRSAGGGVRRGRHRCRAVRHRGRRWRGVDEPGTDGFGADGRGSVRRRRASDSRSSCRRASRPSSSRNASASAAGWRIPARSHARAESTASTAGSRTRSPRPRRWCGGDRGRDDPRRDDRGEIWRTGRIRKRRHGGPVRCGVKVTAGNSSQITDGAAALLLMSEERRRSWGCGRERASSRRRSVGTTCC